MKRNIEDKLKLWKARDDRKPLIIHGARQVGKTFSLKKFGSDEFATVHYLNFEENETLANIFEGDLNPERILRDLSFKLKASIKPATDLLILDEIQAAPRVLTSLKYFMEEMPDMAVCAAGSLLGVHMGETSFPVGKVEFMDMFPMSFGEFLIASGETDAYEFMQTAEKGEALPEVVHERLWDHFKLYCIIGGLPEVVETYIASKDDLFTTLQRVRERQLALVTAYHADVAKHAGKLNSMHIERLWRNVPSQLAREQDASASRFRFKGIIPGVNRYAKLAGTIDWLIAARLLIRVPIVNKGAIPLSAYTKENRFKLYMFDVGILGAVSGISPGSMLDYDYGSYKGYIAENYAAQEFLSAGHKNLYGWSEGTAEVEFLCEDNGVILPVEIKSGWVTQAKSLKVFAEKYAPPYRTVMSGCNMKLSDHGKYHGYPLYLAGRFPLCDERHTKKAPGK